VAKIIRAGEFATAGEEQAAQTLEGLPPDWTVICNKLLVTDNGRSFEIDFIVLGQSLVFAVDEKSWRGPIHGSDQVWVRSDGSSEQSPLTKIDYISRILAGYLRARVAGLRHTAEHFVTGAVLLTQAAQRPAIRDPRARDGVLLLASAVDQLQALDRQGPVVGLVASLRREILRELMDLSDRPNTPKRILDYNVIEVMAGRPGARVFQAVHPDAGPRTLVVYDVRDADEEQRQFFLREFHVLRDLRATGLVPEVGDPFVWSDDFLVVPIAPIDGRPLGSYRSDDGLQELCVARASFQSLATLHAKGVVHRALGPDAVVVLGGGTKPRVGFANFHAARHGQVSISSDLDALLQADPYAAPELAAGYAFATDQSDSFSLALIWLERLSGKPVRDLRDDRGCVVIPSDASWPRFSPETTRELRQALGAALTAGPMAPLGTPQANRASADEVARALDDIIRGLQASAALEQGYLLDGRYAVRRILGEGASARTFLVFDQSADGLFAVKQLRRVDASFDEVKREFNLLKDLASPNLPRVYWIGEPHNDVHLILEYVEGPTLKELEQTFPWQLERWWALAQGLLNGVLCLEERGLLHRDIKPANIIVRDDTEQPVLIDFGFATRLGSAGAPAGTLFYLPPEAVTAEQPPPTSDQYALAVVLYQVLTGRLPFVMNGAVPDQTQFVPAPDLPDERAQRVVRVLLRSLSPEPDGRYPTVRALQDALRQAMGGVPVRVASLPALINPWVEQVRGLYRNSATGNADNRGLDTDFARRTYVPTRLDMQLLPRILEERPAAVFLSGNPGDGKTAYLEQVRGELVRRGAVSLAADASGWLVELDGHRFQSCYDASEAHGILSADEQLSQKLGALVGSSEPQAAVTVLVAINDGRLLDFFESHRGQFGWLASQIERARRGRPLQGRGVWLIDLKRRSFFGLSSAIGEPSVFQRVLDRLVAAEEWQLCDGCAARPVCPIVRNAAALRSEMDGSAVRERLERLLLIAHLRGQHHTTMRDLRSALARLITANLGCQDIHAACDGGSGEAPFVQYAYWRQAFTAADAADTLLADLAALDPARLPQPALDRFLFFAQGVADTPRRRALFASGEDMPPEQFGSAVDWLGAMKQRLLFEARESQDGMADAGGAPAIDWRRLIPYHHLEAFLQALRGRADLSAGPKGLLRRLAAGISASDGVLGQVAEGQLCLRVASSDEQRMIVLKQFPLTEFRLVVVQPQGDQVEAIPRHLRLGHVEGTPHLDIPLDLFELLMRLADGLRPTAPELTPLLEDLVPFKATLLLRDSLNLVLVEGNRRIHRVTQRDGKIVRLAAGA